MEIISPIVLYKIDLSVKVTDKKFLISKMSFANFSSKCSIHSYCTIQKVKITLMKKNQKFQ